MFELAQEIDGFSQAALMRMGWTRRLIARVLAEPDAVRPRRGGCCRNEYVYLRSRVQEAMADDSVQGRRDRSVVPSAWYKDWREALPDACAGLFELNRWAKHSDCLWEERERIYGCKDGLVEILYREGFCVGCREHLLVQPAKVCWDCDGEGCGRCDYTGEYLPARTLRFYCFRFVVGERTFSWHQPDRLVRFTVRTTEASAEWPGVQEEKPVRLSRRQLAAALALVQWVVKSAAAEKAVAA